MGGQERPDHVEERGGCSRWAAWPAPGTTANGAVPADGWRQALGRGRELGGRVHRPAPAPDGPMAPRRSHSGDPVRCPPGAGRRRARPPCCAGGSARPADPAGGRANSGWASQPPGRRPRRRLEAGGPGLVAGPPGPPARRVVEPAVAPISTRPDRTGLGQGQVQAQASAHRVADVHARPPVAPSSPAPVAQVGRLPPEPPWPGASTRTTRWPRRGPNRPPRPAGLGEPWTRRAVGPVALLVGVQGRREGHRRCIVAR